jgi:predicted CXXCH cytochrome family protein
MRILRAFAPSLAVALLLGGAASARAVDNGCVACHQDLDEPLAAPVRLLAGDIHSQRGLGCHDCHGGDPTSMDVDAAMNSKAGFRAAPRDGQQVVALCTRCHASAEYMHRFDPGLRIDQLAEYRSSGHGRRLYATGDPNVATCTSCHGVHGIRAVRDPQSPVYPARVADTCAACHADAALMKKYNLPSDAFAKYRRSVHAELLYKQGDLGAPTCNDCHGNHGAAPPGGGTVANVCGQCHVFFKEYFLTSPHREPFGDIGECVHCHSNHEVVRPNDQWVGAGPQAVCVQCHSQGDAGFAAAAAIRASLRGLAEAVEGAAGLLDRAEEAGMEISQPRFDLRQANEALVKARSLVHTLDPQKVAGMTGEGMAVAARVQEKGLAALAELRFRRRGLLLSLVPILGLVAGLIWKIREIDRRRTSSLT